VSKRLISDACSFEMVQIEDPRFSNSGYHESTRTKTLKVTSCIFHPLPKTVLVLILTRKYHEKGAAMTKKPFKAQQMINKRRESEILFSQGTAVGEASRKLRFIEQTYYGWCRE
jgi:hypothetical protein